MWVLHASTLVFVIYALCSLIIPARISWRARIIWIVITLVCGLKYVIYEMSGGILEPQLSPRAIVILESLYSALMLAVFMAIIKDLLLLVLFLVRKLTGKDVPAVRVGSKSAKRGKGAQSRSATPSDDDSIFDEDAGQEFSSISAPRPAPLTFRRWGLTRTRLALVIAVLSFSIGWCGTLYQYKTPDVYSYDIAVSNLPREWQGYKIVQLTDLHLGPILRRDWLEKVVARTNAMEPDLVLITGDFVDGSVERLKDDFLPLKDLKARHGVLAVTGNHEYYSGANSWVKALEELGIKFLHNESILLDTSATLATPATASSSLANNTNTPAKPLLGFGAQIDPVQSQQAAYSSGLLRISGVPDPRGTGFGDVEPDPAYALSKFVSYPYGYQGSLPTTAIAAPSGAAAAESSNSQDNPGNISFSAGSMSNTQNGNATQGHDRDARVAATGKIGNHNIVATVLMAHEPVVMEQHPIANLILSGHTHGGTMFFLKPIIARFNAGYVSGMYDINPDTKIYVSNGTGIWAGFSCRVLVPSEISLFTLTAK